MADNSEKHKPVITRREAFRIGAASAITGLLGYALGRGKGADSPPAEMPTPSPIAEATRLPNPTQSPSPSPTKQATETPHAINAEASKQEFLPRLINELETYGHQQPLSKEEWNRLKKQLNSTPSEIRPDTYYGTFFINHNVYTQFLLENNNESIQSFLLKHEQKLNQMLGVGDEQSRAKFRRVIVLKDEDKIEIGEVGGQLKDSDGDWFFSTPYKLGQAAYYDKTERIDYGLLHEVGHSMLYLPDQYSLDFQNDQATAVADLPKQWQVYHASRRNDISNDLMSAGRFLNKYSLMQLRRRLPTQDVHNKEKSREGNWFFPNEIPARINLDFGSQFAGAKMQICRSFEPNPDKRPSPYERKKDLGVLGEFTLSPDGLIKFNRDKLLHPTQDKVIEAEISTLLLKITDNKGEKYVRWLDVRDFNIAYWLGHKDEANMKMKAASKTDTPEGFNWEIQYSKP